MVYITINKINNNLLCIFITRMMLSYRVSLALWDIEGYGVWWELSIYRLLFKCIMFGKWKLLYYLTFIYIEYVL